MARHLPLVALPLLLAACGGREDPKPAPKPTVAARARPARPSGVGASVYQDALLTQKLRRQAGVQPDADIAYEHMSETLRDRSRRELMEFYAQRRQQAASGQTAR